MDSFQRLASVLPVVVEAPPSSLRGRRYREDQLYLLARDPRTVLAVWEITPDLHARADRAAREARLPLRYELRIERRESKRMEGVEAARADLPDALGGESWYMTLPRAGGECRALLGISVGKERFEPLLSSGWTAVPPDKPCAEEGAWDLSPDARAWLLDRSRRGVPGSPIHSAVRYAGSGDPRGNL